MDSRNLSIFPYLESAQKVYVKSSNSVQYEPPQSPQLGLLYRPFEVISEKLPDHIHTVLDQSAKTVHPVCFPFSLVDAAIVPVIFTQTFSFVVSKVSLVSVTIFPGIRTLAVFLALKELSLVLLPVFEIKFSETIFKIVFPGALVDIAIPVSILSLMTLIVEEYSTEDVSVKKSELAFYLLIVFPSTAEDSSFAEEVVAFAMLFSLEELSNILVLVGVLEISNSMRKFSIKLTRIDTSIGIDHTSFSLFDAFSKLSNVNIVLAIIFFISIPMFQSFFPLSLIVFVLLAENSSPVLQVVLPRA